MRLGATAAVVALAVLVVVLGLAMGFGVDSGRAAMQAAPLVLAAGIVSALLVAIDREGAA